MIITPNNVIFGVQHSCEIHFTLIPPKVTIMTMFHLKIWWFSNIWPHPNRERGQSLHGHRFHWTAIFSFYSDPTQSDHYDHYDHVSLKIWWFSNIWPHPNRKRGQSLHGHRFHWTTIFSLIMSESQQHDSVSLSPLLSTFYSDKTGNNWNFGYNTASPSNVEWWQKNEFSIDLFTTVRTYIVASGRFY